MNRYINSADALHTLKRLSYETALNQHDPYVADVFEDIAKNRLETWVDLIPTADVPERKVGKWEVYYDDDDPQDGIWKCSSCGYIRFIDDSSPTDFCPHCGAEMRKETEDAVSR